MNPGGQRAPRAMSVAQQSGASKEWCGVDGNRRSRASGRPSGSPKWSRGLEAPYGAG
jgi:hypothetical protein